MTNINENIIVRQLNINHQQQENLEDFTVIWIDSNIDKTDDCIQIRARLRLLINYLKTFDEPNDECLCYIKQIVNEKIFLIISGRYSEHVVPFVHDLPQILSIYIYCYMKDDYLHQKQQQKKVIGIFDNIEQLLKKLNEQVTDYKRNQLGTTSIINLKSTQEFSIKNLSKNNAKFVWFQLLIQILFLMPKTNDSIKEMIYECQLQYHGNDVEQQKINEFQQTYKSSDSIK
ncbi:unnamed protein product, partial [Didymodactylos carnosus]